MRKRDAVMEEKIREKEPKETDGEKMRETETRRKKWQT